MDNPATSPDIGNPSMFSLKVDATLGADFIGLIMASVFYGITVLQTIIYYGTYNKDTHTLKVLVGVVWLLDTGSLIMFAHGTYKYLITNYANPAASVFLVRSIASEPIVAATIALLVHMFFAYRIYNLSGKSRIGCGIAIFIVVSSFAPFALGIYMVWLVNTMNQSLVSIKNLHWVAISSSTTSSAIDWTIVATVCYYLWRSNSQIKSTQRMITMLSLYAVSSGLITTLMNMLTLITYLRWPNTLVCQTFTALIAKAHANALMATLNVRDVVRSRNSPAYITPGTSGVGESTLGTFKANQGSGTGVVHISSETSVQYDIPLSETRKPYV